MSEPVVDARGVRARYGGVEVLSGVDLVIAAGTLLALLGPNGAGKTTMVRVLSTLHPLAGGTVRVAGHDLQAEPALVRCSISLSGQDAAVDPLLTGRENLELMARLRHLPRRQVRARASELLARLELEAVADRRAAGYSGGTRRRLDLAMSLVRTPRLLFLDEPTTGLDPRSREQLWRSIRDLVGAGTTVLLTTQYLEEADRLADEVVVLDGGRVVAAGTATALKTRTGGEVVRLFFAGPVPAAAAQLGSCGDRWVAVPTDGSVRDVRRVLARVDTLGLEPERVDVARPTLDDVFFALTGSGVGAP